jgi:predicted DNA-binding transcriptional regulator AlpA
MIRPRPLAQRLGLSVTTIWRLRQKHEFPEPVRISKGACAWREADIAVWVQQREKAAR